MFSYNESAFFPTKQAMGRIACFGVGLRMEQKEWLLKYAAVQRLFQNV